MFILADNEEIGQYLMKHIEEHFESHRQFCKQYLIDMDKQADKDEIQKMSNRLSQILSGKKEIQLYDLPSFCRLLEVSCEDILSAGKSHVPASVRLTNYLVAFSKDEHEWEAYVTRKDSLILNADEYGKTVIDYALEAENYGFLKYLMDKQYIWFIGENQEDYLTGYTGFGAGTSIEKAVFPYCRNRNILDVQLKMRDELRMHMVALAIRHEDIEMLERLHAREIPELYQMSYYSAVSDYCKRYDNAKLMKALAYADNKILGYFSEEFGIPDRKGNENKFIFPFLGELLEKLLQTKNKFVEYMLEDAIQHNQYVYDQLLFLLTGAVQFYEQRGMTETAPKYDLKKIILRDLRFYDNGNLISYWPLFSEIRKGLRSNIIRVNAESSDTMINRRILELNNLYDAIHHITPEFEGKKDHSCLV